ncbi:MAG: hypothetical protein IPJ12_00860 [Betaproteobacteria bacterium]|nr:hypothetical protein [Betaproteobacteria bacterium]
MADAGCSRQSPILGRHLSRLTERRPKWHRKHYLMHGEWPQVEIFRYVTEGSFDSYMWQTLETKARFIAQVMKGDQGIRSLEDVELAALSYAEVKALASGNPLVIEKAGVDAEVAKLSTLFSVWRNQRYANESEMGRLPMM